MQALYNCFFRDARKNFRKLAGNFQFVQGNHGNPLPGASVGKIAHLGKGILDHGGASGPGAIFPGRDGKMGLEDLVKEFYPIVAHFLCNAADLIIRGLQQMAAFLHPEPVDVFRKGDAHFLVEFLG